MSRPRRARLAALLGITLAVPAALRTTALRQGQGAATSGSAGGAATAATAATTAAPKTGGAAAIPARPAASAASAAPAAARGSAESRLQGTPYSRPVDVPAAGWVRVPLDLAALRHMGLSSSVRVTGPGGDEVSRWVAPFVADSERRPVKVLDVQEDDRGWTLHLDVGPEPLIHERLLLDFANLTAAPAVTLDASQDGKSWEPLVAGDLFRLGHGDTLARTSLFYPATGARFLRLAWPRRAGFPELRAVLVEPRTPGRSLTITSPNNPCRTGVVPTSLACRLPLPAAGQTVRRLTVELGSDSSNGTEGANAANPGSAANGANIAGAGIPVGYRLYQPRQGAWQPLAAGVWRGNRATRHVILLPGEPLSGDALRLELFTAASDPPPRLLSHSFDLAVDTVLFYAEAPGRFVLSYGGVPTPEGGVQRDASSVSAGVDPAWIDPGPEEESRQPSLPAAAAPGAPLSGEKFRASWPLAASDAATGSLMRLELPDAVYAHARPDLGDVRLAVGNRQIPYIRWSPPEPVAVLERGDLRPEAEKGRRYSRIEVALPAIGLPITELDLATPPSPLRRPIGVRYPDPAPPGLTPREERLVARDSWDCLPEPPLPCRLTLPLVGPASPRLAVRFADGDNAPLSTVDLSVWRRGDVLLFAWPGGKVRLLAGAPELAAPVYDLAALADVLPARPWQSAVIDLEGDPRQGEPPWWSRWALPGILAAAGVVLLVLLRRILAEV